MENGTQTYIREGEQRITMPGSNLPDPSRFHSVARGMGNAIGAAVSRLRGIFT